MNSPALGKPSSTSPIGEPAPEYYVLRLYVSGATQRSIIAIANLKAICEKHLHGRYDLQVIDIYEQPEQARTQQLIAVPTLIKQLPLPSCRLVGDFSKEEQVLIGLDLIPRPSTD